MARPSKKRTIKKKQSGGRSKSRRSEAVVDVVQTTTELRTEPKVEVRRAATLSQALTEPAVAVVKPETRVVARKVERSRRAA